MDKFHVVDGSRVEAERELVETLFTPWDKQRLLNSFRKLKPKGKLSVANSSDQAHQMGLSTLNRRKEN